VPSKLLVTEKFQEGEKNEIIERLDIIEDILITQLDQHKDIIELQGELHGDIERLKTHLSKENKKDFSSFVWGVLFEMTAKEILTGKTAIKAWEYILKGSEEILKLLP